MTKTDYSGLTALVVDDNRSVRDFTRTLLVTMGFGSVKIARDSAQATQYLKVDNFDLILSDAVMPGMDGLGLLAFIRDNPKTKDIPFIMISGFAEQAISAAAGGVTDFIVKPFTFELFSQKVNAILTGVKRPHRLQPMESSDGKAISAETAPPVIFTESTPVAESDELSFPSQTGEVSSQANEENTIDQVLSKYGATRIQNCRTIHGNNAGCHVSVFIRDAVCRKQLEEILQECSERRVYKMAILGRRFECGLFPCMTRYAQSRGIELSLYYITIDSSDNVIDFVPVTHLDLSSQGQDGRTSFEITSFAVADTDAIRKFRRLQKSISGVVIYEQDISYSLVSPPAATDEVDWQSLIRCWGLILNYNKSAPTADQPLDWASMSNPQKSWRTPEFKIDGACNVAVVVLDFLGNTSIRLASVSGGGIMPPKPE